MWILFMYVGPILSAVALAGIPIRVIQLIKGDIRRRYQRLVPWGKAIVGLAALSAVGVLAAAGGAAFALYSHLTCDAGGGCAQGEFSVAFSFGVLGVAYVVFELLLLPLTLPVARVTHAQPNL
jgi:hypothetical protein